MSQNHKSSTLPDALRNFPYLPDEASIRLPVMQGLYACSKATIWRMVKAGTIPAPRKHSPRCTVWSVGEVKAALAAKAS